MTAWQCIRFEYWHARRQHHGRIASLRIALDKLRELDATIPF